LFIFHCCVVRRRYADYWMRYAVDNLKHKALLMLNYPAGLRMSEAIRLKVEDRDLEM